MLLKTIKSSPIVMLSCHERRSDDGQPIFSAYYSGGDFCEDRYQCTGCHDRSESEFFPGSSSGG